MLANLEYDLVILETGEPCAEIELMLSISIWLSRPPMGPCWTHCEVGFTWVTNADLCIDTCFGPSEYY